MAQGHLQKSTGDDGAKEDKVEGKKEEAKSHFPFCGDENDEGVYG